MVGRGERRGIPNACGRVTDVFDFLSFSADAPAEPVAIQDRVMACVGVLIQYAARPEILQPNPRITSCSIATLTLFDRTRGCSVSARVRSGIVYSASRVPFLAESSRGILPGR